MERRRRDEGQSRDGAEGDAVRFSRAGRCPRKTDKGGLLVWVGGGGAGGTHTREVRAGLEAWTARAELLRGGGRGDRGQRLDRARWTMRASRGRIALRGQPPRRVAHISPLRPEPANGARARRARRTRRASARAVGCGSYPHRDRARRAWTVAARAIGAERRFKRTPRDPRPVAALRERDFPGRTAIGERAGGRARDTHRRATEARATTGRTAAADMVRAAILWLCASKDAARQ